MNVETNINTPVKHSMLIVGTNTTERNEGILNFKVENSSGRTGGVEGHYTMPFQLFKESVVEVAIPSDIAKSFFQKNNFILTEVNPNI